MTIVWAMLNDRYPDFQARFLKYLCPSVPIMNVFAEEVAEYGRLGYTYPGEWTGCHFHIHAEDGICAQQLVNADDWEGGEVEETQVWNGTVLNEEPLSQVD